MASPPSYHVRVFVRDRSGHPVPGASVEAVHFSDAHLPPAETDAKGIAGLDIPAGTTIANVLALKNGAGFDYFDNPRGTSAGPPDLPDQIDLVLGGAMEVEVRAVDSSGRPLPDTPLTPWTIRRTGRRGDANCSGCRCTLVRTDAAGVARFGWIPEDVDDVTQFIVADASYHCPHTAWIDPADPLRPLTARLLRATKVGGTVRFVDGNPAEGVTLQAEGRGRTNFYCRRSKLSRADGGYEFLLWPEQSYLIAVTDDGWVARSLRGVIVREGQPLTGLDFQLVKGTRLHGLVTVGEENKPAGGQTVTLIERGEPLAEAMQGIIKEEGLVRWASTGDDGRYEIRLGPGRFRLKGPHPAAEEELTLEGEDEVIRDFPLPRPGRGLLSGEVRRVGGQGVGHAVVLAYSTVRGHAWLEAVADAEGRFAGERWLDPMVVYARDPDGTVAGGVEIGESDGEVAVVIAPAATARGRVVDTGGVPRGNEAVFCRMRAELRDGGEVRFQSETRTDAGGSFAISGLLPGSSCDVVVLKGHHPLSARHPFQVESPGELVLPELVMEGPGGKGSAS